LGTIGSMEWTVILVRCPHRPVGEYNPVRS
jgi:hypothetical protein